MDERDRRKVEKWVDGLFAWKEAARRYVEGVSEDMSRAMEQITDEEAMNNLKKNLHCQCCGWTLDLDCECRFATAQLETGVVAPDGGVERYSGEVCTTHDCEV